MANQESIAAQNSNLEKELLVMRMRVAAYEAQSPAASPANSPGGSTPGGKTELSSYCATPAEVAEIEAAVAVACPAGGADVDKSALADRLAPLFAVDGKSDGTAVHSGKVQALQARIELAIKHRLIIENMRVHQVYQAQLLRHKQEQEQQELRAKHSQLLEQSAQKEAKVAL